MRWLIIIHRGWLWPIGLVCVVGALYWAAQVDALAYLPQPVHREQRLESMCSERRVSYGCLNVRLEADARVPTLLGAVFKRQPQWIRHMSIIYQVDNPKTPSFRRPIKEIDLIPYPHTRYKPALLDPRPPMEESITDATLNLYFSSYSEAYFSVQSDWFEDRNNALLARFEFDVPPLDSR